MLDIELMDAGRTDAAVRIFHRDGFVAIRDALTPGQLELCRGGAARVIAEQTAATPLDGANRGFARYSFGDQLHHAEWQQLVDLPTTLPIVDAIWGTQDHTCSGAGGDYSLPGAGIQALHSDLTEFLGDPLGRTVIEDLPAPFIVVNFLMVDFTRENGAIRFVPCTQRSRGIPTLEDEPPWMRNGIVCAPAGTALIRDVRCWHGGTANRSHAARAMTSVGYYAPWRRPRADAVLPLDQYRRMSPRARSLCRNLVAPSP